MVPPKHVGAPQTIKKQKAVSNRYIHPTKNHKSVTKKEGPRKEKGPPWAPVPPPPPITPQSQPHHILQIREENKRTSSTPGHPRGAVRKTTEKAGA